MGDEIKIKPQSNFMRDVTSAPPMKPYPSAPDKTLNTTAKTQRTLINPLLFIIQTSFQYTWHTEQSRWVSNEESKSEPHPRTGARSKTSSFTACIPPVRRNPTLILFQISMKSKCKNFFGKHVDRIKYI